MPKLIDPYEYAKVESEIAQQTALFIWASQNLDKYPDLKCMFAIPNGGSRDIREATRLVASGVKRGVPDLLLAVKRGKWSGLFVEMKKKSGRVKDLSSEQFLWAGILREQGYGVATCFGFEHAKDTLIAYLNQ